MNESFLFVRNLAQKILWDTELMGQISDGTWENARPENHWEPWAKAEVVVEPTNVGRTFFARRDTYNFTSTQLLEVIGDRMLAEVQKEIPDYTYTQMLGDLRDLKKIIRFRTSPRYVRTEVTRDPDWGYVTVPNYDTMLEAARAALGTGISSTFIAKLKEGESIQDYASNHRRIHGPCEVVTTIYRDGGINQKVYEL